MGLYSFSFFRFFSFPAGYKSSCRLSAGAGGYRTMGRHRAARAAKKLRNGNMKKLDLRTGEVLQGDTSDCVF